MLRKFASAAVIVVMFATLSLAADKDKKKGKKGPKLQKGKITKVEGDKVTVALGRKGAKGDKVFTITPETKFVTGKGKGKKDVPADQAKGQLKAGTKVRIDAGPDGKVKLLHLGAAKKPKKPK